MNWSDTLKEAGKPVLQKTIDEIGDFVAELKADGEAVIKERGAKIIEYLNWLATGTITKSQFHGLMIDTKAMLEGAVRIEQAEAKSRAKKFAKKISFEIFGALIAVI